MNRFKLFVDIIKPKTWLLSIFCLLNVSLLIRFLPETMGLKTILLGISACIAFFGISLLRRLFFPIEMTERMSLVLFHFSWLALVAVPILAISLMISIQLITLALIALLTSGIYTTLKNIHKSEVRIWFLIGFSGFFGSFIFHHFSDQGKGWTLENPLVIAEWIFYSLLIYKAVQLREIEAKNALIEN